MLYQKTLKKLVEQIPGATGCILVDQLGEEVVCYAPVDEYEMKLLGAHMVPIHQRLESIESRTKVREHREVLIRTDVNYIMSAVLANNTYLVVRLVPSHRITPSLENLRIAIDEILKQ